MTTSPSPPQTLYCRLGGYDGITAVADHLLSRLMADAQLGRFWRHRGTDGIQREKQLLIDFLCSNAGGPLYYTGRDMSLAHRGMRLTGTDWSAFIGHVRGALAKLEVPSAETAEVLAFIESTKDDIIDG